MRPEGLDRSFLYSEGKTTPIRTLTELFGFLLELKQAVSRPGLTERTIPRRICTPGDKRRRVLSDTGKKTDHTEILEGKQSP